MKLYVKQTAILWVYNTTNDLKNLASNKVTIKKRLKAFISEDCVL